MKKSVKIKKNIRMIKSVILIIVLGSLVILLSNYLINYVPMPQEFTKNMTFEKYSNFLYHYEIMRYPSQAEVTFVETGQERIGVGIVTDTWNLNFGSVPAGSASTRFVDLANLGEGPAKVIFMPRGNITQFVGFSKNDFILEPNDDVTVEISFNSNIGSVGNYTGEIDKIVKIPKYDMLYIFW